MEGKAACAGPRGEERRPLTDQPEPARGRAGGPGGGPEGRAGGGRGARGGTAGDWRPRRARGGGLAGRVSSGLREGRGEDGACATVTWSVTRCAGRCPEEHHPVSKSAETGDVGNRPAAWERSTDPA